MVTIRVEKGMYGLPYAGIIAQDLLTERLEKEGYFQSDKTPGLWTHTWRPITFTLVVDDFGVKHGGKKHAQHLISALKSFCEIEADWKGKKHYGIALGWDYAKRHRDRKVHLSITGRKRNCSLWNQSPVCKRQLQVATSSSQKQIVHSTSHMNIYVLQTCCRLNHVSNVECNCIGPSQTDRQKTTEMTLQFLG